MNGKRFACLKIHLLYYVIGKSSSDHWKCSLFLKSNVVSLVSFFRVHMGWLFDRFELVR